MHAANVRALALASIHSTQMDTALLTVLEQMQPPGFLLKVCVNATDAECQRQVANYGGSSGYKFELRGQRTCAWDVTAVRRVVNALFGLPRNNRQWAYMWWYCYVRVDQDPKSGKALVRVFGAPCL